MNTHTLIGVVAAIAGAILMVVLVVQMGQPPILAYGADPICNRCAVYQATHGNRFDLTGAYLPFDY